MRLLWATLWYLVAFIAAVCLSPIALVLYVVGTFVLFRKPQRPARVIISVRHK